MPANFNSGSKCYFDVNAQYKDEYVPEGGM